MTDPGGRLKADPNYPVDGDGNPVNLIGYWLNRIGTALFLSFLVSLGILSLILGWGWLLWVIGIVLGVLVVLVVAGLVAAFQGYAE